MSQRRLLMPYTIDRSWQIPQDQSCAIGAYV